MRYDITFFAEHHLNLGIDSANRVNPRGIITYYVPAQVN